MSCEPGKIQVLGVQEVKGEKYMYSDFCKDETQLGKYPIFAKYDPKATWFDQLEPAFGEENSFEKETKNESKGIYAGIEHYWHGITHSYFPAHSKKGILMAT